MDTIWTRRKGRVNVGRECVSDATVFARDGANWHAPVSDPTPGPGSEVLVPAEDPNAKKTDYV